MSDKRKEEDRLLDSNYDGIQEYDNDLPRWWVWLFVGTVVFSVFYSVYYHLGGPGISSAEQFALDMKDLEATRAAVLARQESAGGGADTLLARLNDGAFLEKGKQVFSTNCASCHGASGEGVIGPNLTDDFWIHGGQIADIKKIVEVGVLDKGMVPWKGILPSEDLLSVVAYVWSLHGTNPPNPKAPQGEKAERLS